MSEWPFGDLKMFGYDMIMCDPPWKFVKWSGAGENQKSPEHHYKTLHIGEIKERFPVGHLAAENAILWLWCTNPMIDQQIEVGRHWGFEFCTMGAWVKRTKNDKLGFGTGYRLRCASEPFCIFTNGNPETVKNIRTVIEGPIRDHSRKPDEAYVEARRMVIRSSMGRCLDLFSRESREGWTNWGDENQKFDEVAA